MIIPGLYATIEERAHSFLEVNYFHYLILQNTEKTIKAELTSLSIIFIVFSCGRNATRSNLR